MAFCVKKIHAVEVVMGINYRFMLVYGNWEVLGPETWGGLKLLYNISIT